MKNIGLFLSDQKVTIGVLLMFIMTCVSAFVSMDTNIKITDTIKANRVELEKATTMHSYNMLKFNLKNVDSMASVKLEIQKWYEEEWGAQISALQTVCEVSPLKLNTLMTEDVKIFACKLVD